MRRRHLGWLLSLALLPLVAACATVDGGSPAAGGGAATAEKVADFRALEAESAARLAAEGEALFYADREKASGADFCGCALPLIERGELRRGIREASKALFLGNKTGDAYLLAFATRDLAYAYSLAGELDRAEQYAADSLEHLKRAPREAKREPVLGLVHKVRGDVRLRQGKLAEAIAEYERALAAAEPRLVAAVRASLGNAYLAVGQPGRARDQFTQAEAAAQSPTLRQTVRRGFGELALAQGNHAEAQKLFADAAAAASGPDEAYHRFWALEGVARAQLAAGQRAPALESYRRAMTAAEEVRARFRSDEFKTAFFADLQRPFDDAVGLLVDAGRVEEALEVSERSRARALLDMLRGRVTLSAGANAFADPLGRPLSAAQLRGGLAAGHVLVEYHVLAQRTIAFVVRRERVRAVVIPQGRTALAERVGRLREALRQRAPDAVAASGELHAALIAPLGLAGSEAAVFVPHDVLHHVPLHALRGADGFVIEHRAVSYAPSGSAAVVLSAPGARRREHVVAFGNPDTGSARLALAGAQVEVERIKAVYSGAEVYVQRAATKDRFAVRAPQSELLHVAAHASLDPIDPLYSVIHLARTEDGSGDLEAHEVYRLNLSRTAVVALSACDTGLGRVSRGDEVWGFTRAFLSAGAPALLVSLWPVADEATAVLMARFYQEVRGGASAPAALRAAQLAVLRDERTAHPFFWAPFALVGDWR